MITPEILPNNSVGVTSDLPKLVEPYMPPVVQKKPIPVPPPAFKSAVAAQPGTPVATTTASPTNTTTLSPAAAAATLSANAPERRTVVQSPQPEPEPATLAVPQGAPTARATTGGATRTTPARERLAAEKATKEERKQQEIAAQQMAEERKRLEKQAEIDRAVAERMHNGESLYQIDEDLLRKLSPDLILTQNLCQVCAPSGNEVSQVLQTLENRPKILWLTPRSIGEIFDNLRDLASATNREPEAQAIIDDCNSRIDRLKTFAAQVNEPPRVFCMEWLDPVYACGHWVPELVKLAGGTDALGQEAGESVRISWNEIAEYSPDVIVIMPCGFNLQQTMKEIWISFGKYSPSRSPHAEGHAALAKHLAHSSGQTRWRMAADLVRALS